MMKKQYYAPEINEIKIELSKMIATSPASQLQSNSLSLDEVVEGGGDIELN